MFRGKLPQFVTRKRTKLMCGRLKDLAPSSPNMTARKEHRNSVEAGLRIHNVFMKAFDIVQANRLDSFL
jgi:hypothetical protein